LQDYYLSFNTSIDYHQNINTFTAARSQTMTFQTLASRPTR
jgi:hypothetical protein